MGPVGTSLLEGIWNVFLALIVGYALFSAFTVNRPAATALDYARKWLAWTVLIATMSTLPAFFHRHDGNSIAIWLIGTVFNGALAFLAGWLYGKLFAVKAPSVAVIGPQTSADHVARLVPTQNRTITGASASEVGSSQAGTRSGARSERKATTTVTCPYCGGPARDRQCWSCQAKW